MQLDTLNEMLKNNDPCCFQGKTNDLLLEQTKWSKGQAKPFDILNIRFKNRPISED